MSVKRTDRPNLRSEHLATTRSRVLDAAKTLFAARGYSATTITALAEEAGVAVQTVYSAFGSKAGLARAVLEGAVASSGIREANEQAVRERDGERAIRLIASAASRLYSVEVMLAKLFSAEVAADSERIADGFRLQNLKDLVRLNHAIARHFANKDEATRAAVTAWAISGAKTYDRLVVQAGWSHVEYERWLGETLTGILMPRRRK